MTPITTTDEYYNITGPSAPNDEVTPMIQVSAGADATLGPLNFGVNMEPSATAADRVVKLEAGDNTGYRPIAFNPSGLTKVGNFEIDGTVTMGAEGALPEVYASYPSAPNDADQLVLQLQAGADATLGALTVGVLIHPSATAANRVAKIQAGDNTGYRDVSVAPNANTIVNVLKGVSGVLSGPTTTPGSVATVDAAQTLTGKTINAADNTLEGIATLSDYQTLTNKTINAGANNLVGVAQTGGSVFYTATLAKLTPGGSNGYIQFNVFGVMIGGVNPT